MNHAAPAALPPAGLSGLNSTWSRLVTAPDGDGVDRTWHVLDRPSIGVPTRTLLCVHGNPSWSYLFRDLFVHAQTDVRVVAVDQLGMGFSERLDSVRRLADRVEDLDAIATALGIQGPVVTVAHDWGGPISLGWALRHVDQLDGVVLMNTAVHQPASASAPRVIRAVRNLGMLDTSARRTDTFIRGAFELCETRPTAPVREAFLSPYRTADRREAIADFVADIPLEPDHPSDATLDEIAAGLGRLADTPALLLWGSADRVFSDLYLHDLEQRLPHADVHRYPTAGHFVSEDTDCLRTALDWIEYLDDSAASDASVDDTPTTLLGWRPEHIDDLAARLVAAGIAPGDRVAVMIPPGDDLSATVLACWRVGGVVTLIDAGLGPAGMSRAIRSADPAHLIGVPKALAAARTLRWPGRRLSLQPLPAALARSVGLVHDLSSVDTADTELPPLPRADDVAAMAFTSGATGPSKGVLYDHGALGAQRDAIAATYGITADDRLVAAFAPFALYGPLLDIPSIVPDMDVTAPGTLTATALADAAVELGATIVFASPAALVNVVATGAGLSDAQFEALASVRLLLSAGAPVRSELLRQVAELVPNATIATPYGMTECLPVASITLVEVDDAEVDDAGVGNGVCVGHPIDRVEVAIRPIDQLGVASGAPSTDAGVTGEILVRAPHMRLGYDRLWATDRAATTAEGWHATGDVGHLDEVGRLWVGGRLGHVVTTATGPITPVGVEQAVERLDGVAMAAAVGVGPRGAQQLAVVRQLVPAVRRPRLADLEDVDAVRAAAGWPVAAVLDIPTMPVDRRHNSKIDRARLARWAERVLAGGRMSRP